MPVVLSFRARYVDEDPITECLQRIFPETTIRINYERGHFKCTIPRGLTAEETGEIKTAIDTSHYDTKTD